MKAASYRARVAAGVMAMCAAAGWASAQSYSFYQPRVVIISIDGLRGNVVNDINTPTLMAIARRGTYTLEARTVNPSETTPAHASMLSGFTPKLHGINWDGYKPERSIAVPTLLSIARQASFQTTMIVGKSKLRHVAPEGGIFIPIEGGDEDIRIIREATARAGAGWDILFVHLPQVDLVGHSKGWMSPEYLQRVNQTDQLLGGFIRALPFDATIIITADHGGHGTDHGADRAENMLIPWIITGPSIAPGKVLKHVPQSPVRTMDTAATAASILGLFLPSNVEGKVILDALVPLQLQPDILQDPTDY